MPTFLTTAQKRKIQAEADYIASLGPKGARKASSKTPAPRHATSAQVWLMFSEPHARLHRRDCWLVASMENAGRGWKARLATDEELATHSGCGHCS